ncbi:META domain-containing protein [Methyloprofundus sp.]|uniref:META domain-containing protein n=1 Tax=Methyloprofundus sp. TaxID=2020875 RepID=UPI003D10BCA8
MKLNIKNSGLYKGIVYLLLTITLPVSANEQAQRYRGQYTYGHEVNTFCPANNSQCYWINPATSAQLSQQLPQLSVANTQRPFQPICVILQGRIDRETKADGFAADYDGLIEIEKVYGLCRQTAIVTQGDLQHHRWVLESIDAVKVALGNNTFDLDFEEQMTVTAHIGCYQLTGKAVLRDQYFIIQGIQATGQNCTAKVRKIGSLMHSILTSESTIVLDGKYLMLKNENTLLKYKSQDWLN